MVDSEAKKAQQTHTLTTKQKRQSSGNDTNFVLKLYVLYDRMH